jgi:glucose-6-phosphate isomerase
VERRLSDLRGVFADSAAYERVLADGDPLLYTVHSIEAAHGEGDLHYGIGTLMPGRIGDEYYMTKGHLHSWRPAAEVYIGLSGAGLMLLENEETGDSRLFPLEPNGIVYVPGYTAHRTINTGNMPLTYIGIYPARAGHDYGAIAERNFRKVVAERSGRPEMIDRKEFLAGFSG